MPGRFYDETVAHTDVSLVASALGVRQRIAELDREGEITHGIAEVFGEGKSGVRRVHRRFRVCVRGARVPALRPGNVVIMDKLQPHKAAGVREMIKAAGARVLTYRRTRRACIRSS